jgi:hypothetical protein
MVSTTRTTATATHHDAGDHLGVGDAQGLGDELAEDERHDGEPHGGVRHLFVFCGWCCDVGGGCCSSSSDVSVVAVRRRSVCWGNGAIGRSIDPSFHPSIHPSIPFTPSLLAFRVTSPQPARPIP